MFTHVNAFWVAALLLTLIDIPDFTTTLRRIAGALDRMLVRRQHQTAMPSGILEWPKDRTRG